MRVAFSLQLHASAKAEICKCHDPMGFAGLFSLCSSCGDDRGDTYLLQHRVARGPTRFSASARLAAPELCREPYDCLNTSGRLYSYERARERAEKQGANLRSWCYISERDVIPLISACVHQELQVYAKGQFERSRISTSSMRATASLGPL